MLESIFPAACSVAEGGTVRRKNSKRGNTHVRRKQMRFCDLRSLVLATFIGGRASRIFSVSRCPEQFLPGHLDTEKKRVSRCP